ncbi:MAG: transcription-repair coupling factor, partial [Chthoniobacterales bacterium]
MQDSAHAELLARVSDAEPIAAKLRAITNAKFPVPLSHVTEAAQPFLVATLAREVAQTLWVLCPTVRAQELLYESLLNWTPGALFLPEAEFAAVENILPDPEIAAERLDLLKRVSSDKGPHVIVATRASLDQAAPKKNALSSSTLRLKRGRNES